MSQDNVAAAQEATESVKNGGLDGTTVAGVEALESMAHAAGELTPQQEDIMLQNRILTSRIQEERLCRQKIDEEAKFLKHQVVGREKKITALETQAAVNESRICQLQRLVDEKDKVNVQLKQSSADLLHQITGLKSTVLDLQRRVRASGGPTAHALVPDRRFEEAFQDKVAIIRLQKKVMHHFATQETTMQALERNAMEAEDACSTLANELGVIDKVPRREGSTDPDDNPSGAANAPRRVSSLVSFESVKRYTSTRGTGSLPYREALDLSTPQDAFVSAKVNASAFNRHLAPLHEALRKIAHEVKEANDKTLGSLCYIFTDSSKQGKGLLANPSEDFDKEVRQSIVGLRMKLCNMIRAVHGHILSLINAEKPVRLQWALEGRSSIDFSCQVDVPPPEDPRIEQLKEQLSFVNGRSTQLRKEFTTKISQLELLKDKAEVNTQYIQQKILQLHDGLYQSLHAIYRHRFHWVNRFSNAFQGIDRNPKKSTALEVNFNVKLGQAVDEDLHYLRKLADYFVSDEIFGADLAVETLSGSANQKAVSNHANNNNYLVAKRKDSVMPTRRKIDHARKLSGQLETYLRDELNVIAAQQQQQPAVTSTPSTPRGLPSFAAIPVDSEGNSLSNTPMGGSLRDEINIPTMRSGADPAPALAQRYARSANSSPEPQRLRPQSARTRSGSTHGFVPSKPPIVRKASVAAADAGDSSLRRVQSFSGMKRAGLPPTATAPHQQGEVLSCAKVTLQIQSDVLFTAQQQENEDASFVKLGSSVSKSFGARRSVNY